MHRCSLSKDQALGALIMIASIIVIIFYAFVDIYFPLIVLQITAFIAIAAVLVILAWIGYTLMTTPAPKPIVEEPAKPADATGQAGAATTVVTSETQSSATATPPEQPSTTATTPANNTTSQPVENAAAAPKQRASRKQKAQQQKDES